MAATTFEIIWQHYRKVEDATGLGLVAHQYDRKGQSIFLNEGLKTQLTELTGCHWEEAEFGETQTISETEYSITAWDQPFQNLLAGAAVLDGKLYFLRYDWITSLLTDHLPDPE